MLPLAIVLGLSAIAACSADTTEGGPGLVTSKPEKQTPSTPSASPSGTPVTETGDTTPPDTDTPTDTSATKKELGITWFGQENGYYCGPGSTKMAISARVQAPPSQNELGTFMGTTTGGTDNIGLVVKALNKYVDGAGYVARDISDPPTQSQRELLKKDILARMGAGFPMVANVISGWRPPGYPSGTIYHYVALVGYDEGGDKVQVADPAAEGSGGANWKNVPRTYWVDIDDLATWIGGKGYTGGP